MLTPGNICDGCNLTYQLAPENTTIYYFDCQPWFSYGQAMCPQCRQVQRLFWRENFQEYLDYFILQDFRFEAAEFADDLTVASFEQCYGVHTEEVVELTPRLEMEVHNLHVVLEGIPDDLLFDILQTPTKSELPERWTGA